MLTHRFPWPPNRGDKIRSYNILPFLSQFCEVSLLSFIDKKENASEDTRYLKDKCVNVRTIPLNFNWAKIKGSLSLLSQHSLSVSAFRSTAFLNAYKKQVDSFNPDCVFTDSSALASYPLFLGHSFASDFMDVDSKKWKIFSQKVNWPLNWIYRLESKRLAQFEKRVVEKARFVLVVSEEERRRLADLAPKAHIEVIQNGVNQSYFSPTLNKPIPNRIVFTGVMDYFPNVMGVQWFCLKVWPLIKKQIPQASFSIVGSNPSRSVLALTKIPGIEVTGAVPDVRPYLAQAQICVAPLTFSIGSLNKIIEALAMGKVVVSTSSSIRGLRSEVKEVVKVADTAEKFAQAVVELLQDSQKRQKYEKAGLDFVKEYHDWNQNLQPLKKLLKM